MEIIIAAIIIIALLLLLASVSGLCLRLRPMLLSALGRLSGYMVCRFSFKIADC